MSLATALHYSLAPSLDVGPSTRQIRTEQPHSSSGKEGAISFKALAGCGPESPRDRVARSDVRLVHYCTQAHRIVMADDPLPNLKEAVLLRDSPVGLLIWWVPADRLSNHDRNRH